MSKNVNHKSRRQPGESSYTGHYDFLDVGEDIVPLLAVLRRMRGHERAHVAGLDAREDATIADVLQIVGNVVNHLFTCAARNPILSQSTVRSPYTREPYDCMLIIGEKIITRSIAPSCRNVW